jgi:methyl-accepting chemotaxis protein
MKYGIFNKLVVIFLIISIVPTLIAGFSIVLSYEVAINKYFPEGKEFLREELSIIYGNIKIQAALVILLILALVIFVSMLISRKIVYPLKKLLIVTREVSKGNLNAKVLIKTNDEMEELANSFNKMIKDLKESRLALEESKTALEIKVVAKTKELRNLTQDLERKVEERTKTLQEKMIELERFNKLTVGRELKMIELKKEIKKLKEELEEK